MAAAATGAAAGAAFGGAAACDDDGGKSVQVDDELDPTLLDQAKMSKQDAARKLILVVAGSPASQAPRAVKVNRPMIVRAICVGVVIPGLQLFLRKIHARAPVLCWGPAASTNF